MSCYYRDAVVRTLADMGRLISEAGEEIDHRCRKLRGLCFLETDDVGIDPLEKALDRGKSCPDGIEVPGRDTQPLWRRFGRRERRPQGDRRLPPLEPSCMPRRRNRRR